MSYGYNYGWHRTHAAWEVISASDWPCSVLLPEPIDQYCRNDAIAFFQEASFCEDHLGPAWTSWLEGHEEMRHEGLPVSGHGPEGLVQAPGIPQLPDDAFAPIGEWGPP